jgi:hypothetical protein
MFDEGRAPYCASCKQVPEPVYHTAQGVPTDVASIDYLGVLPADDVQFWASWP